jgi:hypothetical protein
LIYLENGEYDNDDNPYGKFVYHRYTNMVDINDTESSGEISSIFFDYEIPLVVNETYMHSPFNAGKGYKFY